ncbi:MAG: vitamin B12 dependent-methionine synthase activation domain-containing protein [Romboutsia sp.]|uniref:vitamin B12 dependent-methionine synthase activation domain-containing protein n=1 Tax=Romboutsia sp. TaxID=1965302 RepID=UPI003F3A1302
MIKDFVNLIKIDKNEVLRYLEYNGQNIDDNLNNSIDQCIEITKNKVNPRYLLRVYPILREKNSLGDDEINLKESNLRFKSKNLYKLLNNCEECIILSATLGLDIEKEIRKYSYIELTKSIIIDACSTTAIEEVCDLIEEEIKSKLKGEGKYITMRYSPGYGDLPVEKNKDIVEVLNLNKELGLTINEGGIMIPRKSVIAIIGVSSKLVKETKKSCKECSNYKICKYRKGDGFNGCKGIYKK